MSIRLSGGHRCFSVLETGDRLRIPLLPVLERAYPVGMAPEEVPHVVDRDASQASSLGRLTSMMIRGRNLEIVPSHPDQGAHLRPFDVHLDHVQP